mgnify:CR=1 FL=1
MKHLKQYNSLKLEKRYIRKLKKDTREYHKNEYDRRKVIRDTVEQELQVAMGHIASREARENKPVRGTIPITFWYVNSVMRIEFYNKLEMPLPAIADDIVFFRGVIRRMQQRYKKWIFSVTSKPRGMGIHFDILVQKKQ